MSPTARAYLELAADDRLEARLPHRLKADAEAVARAHGQSLTQWLLAAMAERVAAEYAATLQWQLTPGESVTVLRALAQPAAPTPELVLAHHRGAAMFGETPE